MKSPLVAAIVLSGVTTQPLVHAGLLAYEGFDYPVGSDVNTPLNGGLGFTGAWLAGQQGGVITVYDAASAVGVTNSNAGGEIEWDGVVDHVPTTPTPNRYIATSPTSVNATDRITAKRTLTQSAGALAGGDNVLWASVVWHQQGTNFGRHVGFALGTNGLANRSVNIDGSGDGIGVGGAINTGAVTPTVWDNGNVLVRTTTDAANVSTSLDNLVVLKFVFAGGAGLDRVYAYRFTETDTLLESTFDSNAVFAESAIDENALNIVSFSQSRGQEAIDEIRIGDTFVDVISGVAGPAANDFQLIITPNGSTYDFAWSSLEGKLYDLVSSPDLATSISTWPVWDGRANIPTTPPTNTLIGVPGGGDRRFYAVIEKDAGDADLEAPAVSQTWGSGNTITIVFSEEIDSDAATDPLNYAVTKDGGGTFAVTGATLEPDGKTVTLTLDTALDIAASFSVAIADLTDLAGNPVAPGTVGTFQTWDNEPDGIQVFILAGQSNMVGYGKSEDGGNPAWTPTNGEPKEIPGGLGCLRYLAVNNASFQEYDYTSLLVDPADPATSAWKTRGDVKVWWRNGHSAMLGGEIGKGNLGPPFRGANTSWFGPEYAFGQVIGDYYSGPNERPVLIVKTAWGGKSLHVDFRSPSAVANRGGEVGPYYIGMLADLREVLGDLEGQFPADQHPEFSAVGYRYRIAGIGWHQGWNDAGEPAATDYKDNLPDLIADLRAEFGNPALPFTIASTGMGGNKPVEAAPYPNYSQVEKAQLWVAGVAQPSAVLSQDTRPYWREAAISPSTLGFHWNHSAESYFLVGKCLAENMQTLLAE